MVPFDSNTGQDGDLIAATVKSPSFTGVALVSSKTGAVQTRIEAFDESGEQAGGAYNGRYLVWKDMPVPGDVDNWTLREWDASTGKTRTVGSSHVDAQGNVISSTWQNPIIDGGWAAWVEGLANNGRGEIVALNLSTGKRGVLYRGHPGWLALDGSDLVWAESSKPGALTNIRARDIATGRAVVPPMPLGQARGAWGLVSNGSTWVWVAGNTPTAYLGFDKQPKPLKIAVVPRGGASPPLAISTSAAVVPVSAGGAMVINLTTHAWTYEPQIAWAVINANELLTTRELPVGNKSGNLTTALAAVTSASVASLTCP